MKAGAAVLKYEPRAGWDNAASKGVRDAVDERAGVAFFISYTEVDCVAACWDSGRVTWS